MSPAILIAGAAALIFASGKKKGGARISCPPLSPGKGQIAGYEYIEFATGGANLRDRLPIVFFFHSKGTIPEVLGKLLYDLPVRARVVMPFGRAKSGTYKSWWTGRAAQSDQEDLAAQMGSEAADMVRFVKEANHCLRGVGAPVITGHSQGGMMTFAVAARAPGLAKAAVPVSGWLPVSMWPKSLPPTYVVHGEADNTVDFDRTANFAFRASSAGLPIEFFPIANRGHGLSGELKSTWLELVSAAISK